MNTLETPQEEQTLKKSLSIKALSVMSAAIGLFVFFAAYHLFATVIYTIKLAEFYEVDYQFDLHGIAINGQTSFGNMINVRDLEAIVPETGSGTSEQWCPNVTSKRGHVTMGFVEDISVCCWVADDNQWLVPYKEDHEYRHYFCGKWPFIDEVKQPLSKARITLPVENSL